MLLIFLPSAGERRLKTERPCLNTEDRAFHFCPFWSRPSLPADRLAGFSFNKSDRQMPRRPRLVGGVKGHNQKDISFPGSPGLWPRSFIMFRERK